MIMGRCKQIIRFGVVGGIGFVVDGGLLLILTAASIDAFLARAVSFPLAVIVTWMLNRTWTFSSAEKALRVRQFGRYMSVQILGFLTNYCIYAVLIVVFGENQIMISAAFALGSFCGAFVNFSGMRWFVFNLPQER